MGCGSTPAGGGRNLPAVQETEGDTPRSGPDPFLAKLREGDERAFMELVARHGGAMHRIARVYAPSAADEVVQEAWAELLTSLDRFEGRSSVKTWLFKILLNVARARGRKEGRSIPMSALEGDDEPAVPAERFHGSGHVWAGHWASAPVAFPSDPAVQSETREKLKAAIDELPALQREVMILRDVEEWDSQDVCNALGITDTNQRVLLHRARSRVRASLEAYFEGASRG